MLFSLKSTVSLLCVAIVMFVCLIGHTSVFAQEGIDTSSTANQEVVCTDIDDCSFSLEDTPDVVLTAMNPNANPNPSGLIAEEALSAMILQEDGFETTDVPASAAAVTGVDSPEVAVVEEAGTPTAVSGVYINTTSATVTTTVIAFIALSAVTIAERKKGA